MATMAIERLIPDFTATILDREIVFMGPTEGQTTQLARFMGAAQRAKDSAGTIGPVARALDLLMILIKEDEDRDWVDEGLLDGSIALSDFLAVLEAWTEAAEGKKAAPKKAVTRGRR